MQKLAWLYIFRVCRLTHQITTCSFEMSVLFFCFAVLLYVFLSGKPIPRHSIRISAHVLGQQKASAIVFVTYRKVYLKAHERSPKEVIHFLLKV